MKQLIILRHAQAIEKNSKEVSHDRYRSLTSIGLKQSYTTWNKLKRLWIQPDIVITSSSSRTYQTASIVCSILNISHNQIIIDSNLYRCGLEKWIEVIWYFQKYKSIMIVGHNPELIDVYNYYSDNKIDELKKGEFEIIYFH